MNKMRKLVSLLLALMLCTTTFGTVAMAEEEPFVMTIMAQAYLAEYPPDDAEVKLMIEDYTNTKLDITWVPTSNLQEKLATVLASTSDTPMCVYCEDVKTYNVVAAAQAGVFWDLAPYIEEFPNLAEMYSDPIRRANSSIAGGIYGLFRTRPLATTGIVFRKDWADKLGIATPTTLDEYYNMLVAFKEQDPDGNGVDDTYGISVKLNDQSQISHMYTILAACGAPNEWYWDGETMVPAFYTDEYMDALNFYKKLYDEGLMNADFVTNPQIFTEFCAGRSGSFIAFLSDGSSNTNDLYALYPDASVELIGRLNDRCMAEMGYAGQFLFTKAGIKDEETLRKCLNFFDKLSDEEMQNLVRWGLEGKHYYINEEGKPVRPAEWNDAYINEVNCWRTLKLHYDEKAMDGVFDYAYGRARELYVENEPYAVSNPCAGLYSPTDIELGKDLALIVNDASVQYVVGQITEEDFRAACDQWKSQGGQTIIDEYTAAYLETIK